MNPFMIIITVIQLAATAHEFYYGNKYMGSLYLCYSISNVLMIIISGKLDK
jgi:hypothetical protein